MTDITDDYPTREIGHSSDEYHPELLATARWAIDVYSDEYDLPTDGIETDPERTEHMMELIWSGVENSEHFRKSGRTDGERQSMEADVHERVGALLRTERGRETLEQ